MRYTGWRTSYETSECHNNKDSGRNPTTRTFFFDTSFEPEPGQFVMAWIRGVDEIPMALSYDNAITVQKVGPATSSLFELGEGDSIGSADLLEMVFGSRVIIFC